MGAHAAASGGATDCRAAGSRAVIREAIPDAVDGEQITWLARVGLELAADVLHVRVDRALVRLEGDAVDRVEELRAGEHTTRRSSERREELEFGRCELLDLGITDAH